MLRSRFTIGQDVVRLNAREPVRAQRIQQIGDVAVHDHEFHEICIVTGGRCIQQTDQGNAPLARGQVCLVAPRAVHGFSEVQSFTVLNIYYLAAWFLADIGVVRRADPLVPRLILAEPASRGQAEVVRLELTPAECAQVEAEASDLLRAQTANASMLFREACFFKLIDVLAGVARRQGVFAPVAEGAGRSEVERGLVLIENLAARRASFDAEALAREVGLSSGRFARLVRAQTGMSPRDYFQRQRIYHVARRLLATSLQVAEIAHEFGFADAAHLNRHFRGHHGMSPGQYRAHFGGKIPPTERA